MEEKKTEKEVREERKGRSKKRKELKKKGDVEHGEGNERIEE